MVLGGEYKNTQGVFIFESGGTEALNTKNTPTYTVLVFSTERGRASWKRGVQQATAHKKCAHMGTFYMFSGSRCRRGSQGGTQHKNVPMQAHFVLGFKGGAEGGMGRHPDMKIVPPWA